MFVFFPEDPKVGIKIIKQLVHFWNTTLSLSLSLSLCVYGSYLPYPGIASACRRRTFPVQSLWCSKAWHLLPNRAWWIWHPNTSWSNSWRLNSWSISRNMSWYERWLALFPGHSVEKNYMFIWFSDGCTIKSGSGLGMRLPWGSFAS